jgi:hypothetical protein
MAQGGRPRRGVPVMQIRFSALWIVVLGSMLLFAPVLMAQSNSVKLPEGPRALVDTTPVTPSGKTIHVAARGNLQAAFNNAQPGDVITLEPGTTFTGPFTLPAKNGEGWITVQTSKPETLPSRGTRVSPADAAAMPKIITTTTDPALRTAAGAHHYRFRGIEFAVVTAATTYVIVSLDGAATYSYPAIMTTLAEVPHHLIVEQCYIHGHPTLNVSRGVQLNSAHTAIIDSYISDIHGVGFDTQALGGWNGPGPFKIVNNYLAGAGENIMFGGGLASIANLVPSDIEIRRNHISKPLSWKVDDPTYAGKAWSIKNLLELKNAQRVLIDSNVFEYHWPSAQSGFAVVLTPRSELNDKRVWAMPWATVSNIAITNNVFRSIAAGVAISGRDEASHGPTVPGTGFLIRNNLFYDIGTARWRVQGSFAGALFMIVNGVSDVTIEHNTSTSPGSFIITEGAQLPNKNVVYRNNIHPVGYYGVVGDGSTGGGALTKHFPGIQFRGNVLIGPYPSAGGLLIDMFDREYPGNFYPNAVTDVFVDSANANYRLQPRSKYRNAGTDGKDPGADVDSVRATVDGVAVTLPSAATPK